MRRDQDLPRTHYLSHTLIIGNGGPSDEGGLNYYYEVPGLHAGTPLLFMSKKLSFFGNLVRERIPAVRALTLPTESCIT